MIRIEKKWLAPVPWESVLNTNQTLCQAREVPYKLRDVHEKVHAAWENSLDQRMPLIDALDLCRKSQEMAPFDFFNANTFAAVGKAMLEEGLNQLPAVEAQIIATTVSHYIAGQIKARELTGVLNHFEALWKERVGAPRPAPAPTLQTVPPRAAAPPITHAPPRSIA